MPRRCKNKQSLPRTSELILDAGDGRGNYWVNAGIMCFDSGLDIPRMARRLLADGETTRLVGGKCFVLMSEVRAEHYRRIAEQILRRR